MKRRDRQTRRERGRRTEQGRTEDEGIIYGRGKESGGQNNSEDGRDAKSDTHTRTDDRRTVDPKLANEARKRAKSQDVERSSNSPTSFVRGSVRRMKKRKLFSAASIGDMTVRQRDKERQRNGQETSGFLSSISPIQQLNVSFICKLALLFFDDSCT